MSETVKRAADALEARLSDSGLEVEDGCFLTPHAGWVSFDKLARTVISAIREPAFDPESVSYHEGMSRADWWRAMIDTALGAIPDDSSKTET